VGPKFLKIVSTTVIFACIFMYLLMQFVYIYQEQGHMEFTTFQNELA